MKVIIFILIFRITSYNVCYTKLLRTEYISVGEPYQNIKKVYSINIVYFDLGQGDDYVYHGKTDFIGIHNADRLMLSAKQTEMLGRNNFV